VVIINSDRDPHQFVQQVEGNRCGVNSNEFSVMKIYLAAKRDVSEE